MPTTYSGSCLCGAVHYEVHGPLRPIVYCHCGQCRKTSGHFVAPTACLEQHLTLRRSDTLQWYASSAKAERGFCRACGGNLFWRPTTRSHISIMAGTLDNSSGIDAIAHIHADSAASYVPFCDGLPVHAGDGPDDLAAGE